MNYRFVMLPAVVSLAIGIMAADKPARPQRPAEPAAPLEDLDEWVKLRERGPAHDRLDTLVGEWDLSLRVLDGDRAVQKQGTARYVWKLGRRFLLEEASAVLEGDQPFEWMGLLGYDNVRKVYTVTWADNMDTITESADGTLDASGRVLTFRGTHKLPGGGQQKFLWIYRFGSADGVTVEMSEIETAEDSAKELTNLVLEMKYRRRR